MVIKPAAFNGSIRILKMLLNEGAELNAVDTENESALHGAVFGGHIEAVTFLLRQGIKPDTIGHTGTPLNIAIRTGQVSIANILSGDDTSADDDNPNQTPPPLAPPQTPSPSPGAHYPPKNLKNNPSTRPAQKLSRHTSPPFSNPPPKPAPPMTSKSSSTQAFPQTSPMAHTATPSTPHAQTAAWPLPKLYSKQVPVSTHSAA